MFLVFLLLFLGVSPLGADIYDTIRFHEFTRSRDQFDDYDGFVPDKTREGTWEEKVRSRWMMAEGIITDVSALLDT